MFKLIFADQQIIMFYVAMKSLTESGHYIPIYTDEMINNSIKVAKERFNLQEGDLVVITGGFTGETFEEHSTNLMKIVNIK